jgi:hypothetical protein
MLDQFIFNEDIKRIVDIISNSQIVQQSILKDYISNVKIITDNKKIDKNNTNLNPNNSKNLIKYNDSFQNLISINNVISQTISNSNNQIINVNNSYLYSNSSFSSLHLDKLEGIIFECKWKNKYILLLRFGKIKYLETYYKSIEIECLEMNHYENAFTLEISIYWNTTELQTLILIKFLPKNKIIEEIIRREFNHHDKKIIYNNICNYLKNDLTGIDHCATTLIFGNMKEISIYLSDLERLIKLGGIENKRIEIYKSSLISSGQNCLLFDIKTGQLCQELIFSGYFANKKRVCQLNWDKKINNKNYCTYKIYIIYLEENISLLVFWNVWQQHVPRQLLYEVENKKKALFDDVRNYFIQKSGKTKLKNFFSYDTKQISLNLGIKDYKKDEETIYFNDIIHDNSYIKSLETKNKSLAQNNQSNYTQNISGFNNSINNNTENIFTNTIQNISDIENISTSFFLE